MTQDPLKIVLFFGFWPSTTLPHVFSTSCLLPLPLVLCSRHAVLLIVPKSFLFIFIKAMHVHSVKSQRALQGL